MELLIMSAIFPVILLGGYIYKKDIHKEPKGLLTKIFVGGMLICFPVILVELLVGKIFSVETSPSFIEAFINVFFGVAIVEEGFKWFITHKYGYKSREFDEIYDIIVYSTFASLGFACLENILYVVGNGFDTAIVRALLAIPGHACDGVFMGYFMSKAKVNEMNNQHGLAKKNLALSLLVPTISHTIYDALLSYEADEAILIFLAFHIITVIVCFIIIKKMSTIQQNITTNIEMGNIQKTDTGVTYNTQAITNNEVIKFCPICGRKVEGYNFCPNCGFKVKEN